MISAIFQISSSVQLKFVVAIRPPSFVWTIVLCVCHTTPTQNDPVCSLLSGWVTTTGRLLGPKMTLRHATRYCIGVELRFRTFRLLARRSTN